MVKNCNRLSAFSCSTVAADRYLIARTYLEDFSNLEAFTAFLSNSDVGNLIVRLLAHVSLWLEDVMQATILLAPHPDPPRHAAQRKAVAPIVSPMTLRKLDATIRERTVFVLDTLPRDETFDLTSPRWLSTGDDVGTMWAVGQTSGGAGAGVEAQIRLWSRNPTVWCRFGAIPGKQSCSRRRARCLRLAIG